MNWLLFVSLNIILTTTVLSTNKYLLKKMSPFQIVFFQYLGSIVTIFIVGLVKNQGIFFRLENYYYMIVGIVLAIGVICLNNAMRKSLAKTMIVNQFNGLFATILAAIFLAEWELFNPNTNSGILLSCSIVLSVISILLMSRKSKGDKDKSNWATFAILASILIGSGLFLAKAFVAKAQPLEILFFQYIGSFITLITVVAAKKVPIKLGFKNTILATLVGVFMSISLNFLYIAFSLAPLANVQTVQRLGITILGLLSGLILFKERKDLNRRIILGMLLGITAIGLAVSSSLLRN